MSAGEEILCEKLNRAYRAENLLPGDVLVAVVFARIVQKQPTYEDLGLPFGEVLRPEEIDRVGGALGEEENEDDPDEDAKQTLDLRVLALLNYICNCDVHAQEKATATLPDHRRPSYGGCDIISYLISRPR